MKRTSIFMALSMLVLLIVLPVISSVNDLSSNHAVLAPTLRASGGPIPPSPPKPSMLAASGLFHV